MKNIADIKSNTTGIILAGGRARRLGGKDKGLVRLADRPLVQYVLEAITPQVSHVRINANRNLDDYAAFNFPVISDELDNYCGPLAGMASCLAQIETPYMVTTPCDSPFIPDDLVKRLFIKLEQDNAEISVAHNGERIQPVFVLMKTSLRKSMLDFLDKGERKIDKWFELHKLAITDFSDRPDTFININTEDDLNQVEEKLVT